METKELRIGNYVQSKSGKTIYKITEISEHHLNLSNGTDVFSNHGCEVYPITLTIELLLKCGFMWNDELLEFDGHDFRMYFKNWYIIYNQINSIKIKCIYLHQLQNLYFTLIGEELTIEPF